MENQELINKLKESEKYINEAALVNFKLAHSYKLLCMFHLTLEEKLELSSAFDLCKNEIDVVALFDKTAGELTGEFPDENVDYRWSPKFARDMMKYIKQYKEYDPFVEIGGFFEHIKDYFNMTDNMNSERVINKNDKKADTIQSAILANMSKTRHAAESISTILKDMEN